ncbi:MAG: DNA cytosine methyltransferase [Chromatiales bacterium]|nr:DNA cytosine methyltransferase [Chromatiales bacterium]
MSVEKETSAHRTLQLRAFYRQFGGDVPDGYFDYLRSDISRDELFRLYPREAATAEAETLGGPRALGDKDDDRLVHTTLRKLIPKGREPWIQIGGPPCQAYSLVGRARNRGIKGYRAEADHRHFLYTEYLRALDILQPAVFVMENVKGILSSQVAGQRLFGRILEDLSNPRRALGKRGGKVYRLYSLTPGTRTQSLFDKPDSDWLVRSEAFGVPQARHRVILLGVRDDIIPEPGSLIPEAYPVPAAAVLGDLPRIRSGLSGEEDSPEAWHGAMADAADACNVPALGGDRRLLDGIVRGAGRLTSRGKMFSRYSRNFRGGEPLREWLRDERLGGFVNHQSRGHIRADLARYLFCSVYARLHDGASPRSRNFPESLAPDHANWHSGKFADRFKVQAESQPASTVTSHIAKDGHYFIHYDPEQCRSLTVREAARLQTFPDNYFFEGNRTQQYVQVGNAVPPWLARQIADIVYNLLS